MELWYFTADMLTPDFISDFEEMHGVKVCGSTILSNPFHEEAHPEAVVTLYCVDSETEEWCNCTIYSDKGKKWW